MTRCLKCGSTLAPHARFCSVCGAESALPSPQTTGGLDATRGGSAQNMTQNINATQGLGRTSAYGGGAELGTTAAFVAQNGTGSQNSGAGGGRQNAIVVGSVAALVLIAAFIFASASGLLGAKKPDGGGAAVLSAPPAHPDQAPLLGAPAPTTAVAPVITAPPAQNTPMPTDVVDYLRWLKQFEKGRVALESKSEAQMLLLVQELVKVGMVGTKDMGLLGGDPDTESKKTENAGSTIDTKAINGVIGDWNTAAGIFQQKNPPDVCATLASNYNGGLTSSVKGMTEILGAGVRAVNSISSAGGQKTNDASEVLSFLTDQKNNAGLSKSIEGFFSASDQSLDAVRARYTSMPADIDKPQFAIKSGQGGGINIPIPGVGM